VGRCAGCGAWNSLTESTPATRRPDAAPAVRALAQVDEEGGVLVATGVGELDRVLGGGLVPGSTTLLFGEPGVGKSTLALMALRGSVRAGGSALLVAAEESAAQVARRARRLGEVPVGLDVVATAELSEAVDLVRDGARTLVVVDSVSAMRERTLGAVVGSVPQVRHAAEGLCAAAKAAGVALVMVGHVTKDGELSGPRALEHLVDTVLRVEGDRRGPARVVRAVKHRYGPTEEIGLLEMAADGLRELVASAPLRRDGEPEVPGVSLTVTSDGSRCLLVEIQALVASSAGPPRRVAHQVSAQRLALLLAVLETRCGVDVSGSDVFAATAGGLAATEPAADLALALALASVAGGFAPPRGLAALGEVGLAGELRAVPALSRRVREAARHGVRRVLVPHDGPLEEVPGVEVARCRSLGEALAVARGGAG
jgi:DNA repair protein RadA/Sms